MIENEDFYKANINGLIQAILNKGKLQKDIRNAAPLEPKLADFHWHLGTDVIVIERTCRITGEEYTFDVTRQEWARWKKGELIQNVWSTMPGDLREIIQTGWTPAEWDATLGT
tara:strand:- start:216 stop:554 length:339 start_codon:yes stop_codon:yes gene_type:complete